MSGCIYLVTCLENNKKYVGQHCKADPKERWLSHRRSKDKLPFHNALRKYGSDGFTWDVLIVCPQDALTVMEGYYAEVFETYCWDSSPGGYNASWCTENSRLGIKHTPETKEKMRQSKLGKKQSPEHIESVRQIHLGRKNTPDTIEKMRQAQLGKKSTPETKEKLRQSWIKRRAK